MLKDYLKTLAQYLLPKRGLTAFAGCCANIKTPIIKNFLIRDFIARYGVNMQEAAETNPEQYATFNDFFIRPLNPTYRPIAKAGLISPVDGCISELGQIAQGQLIQAKGREYSVQELLACDLQLSDQFQHGHFATLYLAPKDYHRVHMPITARLLEMTYIPGTLFSVQPATARVIPKLFARNERIVALFDTELGLMAMVLVGATIVGSIATSWHGEIKRRRQSMRFDYRMEKPLVLQQADEMGYFKLGSTVVLLFANHQCIQFRKDLAPNVPIRFGEAFASYYYKYERLVESVRTNMPPNSDSVKREFELAIQIRQHINDIIDGLDISVDEKQTMQSQYQAAIIALLHADGREALKIHLKSLKQLMALLPSDYSTQTPEHENQTQAETQSLLSDPLDEINHKIQDLAQIRDKYLPNKLSRLFNLLKVSWVSLDFALLIACTVLGFAFPWLGIPILVLTIASMAYSGLDFLKYSIETTTVPHLGGHVLSKQLQQELEQQFADINLHEFIVEQTTEDQQWLEETHQFNRLNLVLSGLGLLCAAAGILFIFPPAAIPMAAVIAATIINSFVVLGASIAISIKMTRAETRIKLLELKVNSATDSAQKIFTASLNARHHTELKPELSSTAAVVHAGVSGHQFTKELPPEDLPFEVPDKHPLVSGKVTPDETEENREDEHPSIKE